MRTRLLDAPWWVLGLVSGIPFGAVMAVTSLLDGGSVGSAVVSAIVSGVIFGALMGVFQARMNRRAREAVGDVSADRAAVVHRSAVRGPVPDDPEVRGAAVRLVAHQLEQSRRNLVWSMVVFGAFLLLSVWLAVTSSSPWWWGGVVFWCAFIGFSLWVPARLGRRLALLRGDG